MSFNSKYLAGCFCVYGFRYVLFWYIVGVGSHPVVPRLRAIPFVVWGNHVMPELKSILNTSMHPSPLLFSFQHWGQKFL